jgi:flagellar assembly protein FliH
MNTSTVPPQQVASLIEQILTEKDPATVGLRRILRRKSAEACDFPLREFSAGEFSAPGAAKKALTEDEQRILELERELASLRIERQQREERARLAVQKAYSNGYEEGRKKGRQEGESTAAAEYGKKIDAAQQRLASFLKQVEEEKTAIYANADRILLELCCRMVKKILATEPVKEKETILAVLRKALSYIAEREKIVIRVAPGDLETVTGNRDFWTPVTEKLTAVSVEADERIEPGGCIVESNSGITDARLGVQMSELSEIIERTWESIHAMKNTSGADGS